MFRAVRHCALLVQLYFHVVHDVCVGFAWLDGRIVFVILARACYPAGFLSGSPAPVGLRAWQKFVMFVFVCLLCLCAGQASSAGKVHVQY